MNVKIYIKSLAICFLVSAANAQSKIDLNSIKKDLKASSKKLTEHRESVTAEKVELSKQLAGDQAELTQKRRKARLAAMGNADRQIVLAKLESKASAKSREVDYLGGQLGAFEGKVKASMFKGEKFNPEFQPKDDSLTERMKALEAGIDRLEMMIGGAVVDAEVADADGRIQQGKLVSFGPATWFANASGDVAGAVVVDKASRNARLIDSAGTEISKLIAGKEVTLEVDLTGGKARALASISNTPLDLFNKGGAWIWPIIFVALADLI